MDDLARTQLFGIVTAHRMLIEHLFRLMALYDPKPDAFIDAISRAQLEMLDDTRANNAGSLSPDREFTLRQHALHHLERFWAEFDRQPAGPPRGRAAQLRARPERYAWRKQLPRR